MGRMCHAGMTLARQPWSGGRRRKSGPGVAGRAGNSQQVRRAV
jgi:hypothetical protein